MNIFVKGLVWLEEFISGKSSNPIEQEPQVPHRSTVLSEYFRNTDLHNVEHRTRSGELAANLKEAMASTNGVSGWYTKTLRPYTQMSEGFHFRDYVAITEPVWTIVDLIRNNPEDFTGDFSDSGWDLNLSDNVREVNFTFYGMCQLRGSWQPTPTCHTQKWLNSIECLIIYHEFKKQKVIQEEKARVEAIKDEQIRNVEERNKISELYGVKK